MRAAIFQSPGKPIVIERFEPPQLGPDDVLVKVHRCGICGSDVSMTGDAPFTFAAGSFGHEYSGEIVEVGHNVTWLRPSDRVACLPTTPCGICDGCSRGNPIFCNAPQSTHDGRHYGGFADYAALPAAGAKLLPDWLSYSDGALVEPMACGLHALNMAAMAPGANILVLGAGSMAMSTVYWARRLGAGRIVVASRSAYRRDIAQAIGADAFHSFVEDAPAALPELLGAPPDIVVECVGKSGMLNMAIDQVRVQGFIVSLGMCQHVEPLMPAACTFKEARLLFPVGYTVDEFVATARAFDADRVHPDLLVSDIIALEALPAVLDELRAGQRQSLKIHVNPLQDALK